MAAFDQNSGKGGKTASWTWDVLSDGNYEVAAQWSPSSNRAWQVQYQYSLDGGSPINCGLPQNQQNNGGQFNRLCVISALMAGTRVHRLLLGYRDQPPAALEAVAVALINLAQLATDIAEIVEVDINPLLADADGVVSLDARIKVAPAVGAGPERLAIRPYPKELESSETLPDGQEVVIRPIRPEDAPALRRAFKKLTPRDVRFRFFAPMSDLSPAMAARLTQIDYDREMALIAHGPEPGGEEDGWGVVRIAADADNIRAEFAVVVRSDMQGRGNVLAENDAMLALARDLGFRVAQLPGEPGVARITKRFT